MNDLISRKEIREKVFNEMIKAEVNSPVYLTLECVIEDIDNQPIAYDVDKVIERLEEVELETTEEPHAINLYRAIEIVEGGGVDEM